MSELRPMTTDRSSRGVYDRWSVEDGSGETIISVSPAPLAGTSDSTQVASSGAST